MSEGAKGSLAEAGRGRRRGGRNAEAPINLGTREGVVKRSVE